MRSVCYCLSQPHGNSANELIDVISVSAVFEQPTVVCFVGDGVWQLFDETDNPHLKNTTRYLSALPSFGVHDFFVERESLYRLGLFNRFRDIRANQSDSFLTHVEIKDLSVIRELSTSYDIVITD